MILFIISLVSFFLLFSLFFLLLLSFWRMVRHTQDRHTPRNIRKERRNHKTYTLKTLFTAPLFYFLRCGTAIYSQQPELYLLTHKYTYKPSIFYVLCVLQPLHFEYFTTSTVPYLLSFILLFTFLSLFFFTFPFIFSLFYLCIFFILISLYIYPSFFIVLYTLAKIY